MTDDLNAKKKNSTKIRSSNYKIRTEGSNPKNLGYFTSKYFEYNDDSCAKISNEKQQNYLNIAAKLAAKSPVYIHKHGAIIVYKDKIISSGYNYYIKDVICMHAEANAIYKINKKYKSILNECDIYVVRIGPYSLKSFNNPLKYSRPCLKCENTIIKNNIKNVYYSTSYEYDNIRSSLNVQENDMLSY